MDKKIHIGFHKAGSTFLQQIVFPKIPNYKGRYYNGNKDKHTDLYVDKKVIEGCKNILKYYSKFDNHFISNELFTKLKHEKLFELLKKYNYNEFRFEKIFALYLLVVVVVVLIQKDHL